MKHFWVLCYVRKTAQDQQRPGSHYVHSRAGGQPTSQRLRPGAEVQEVKTVGRVCGGLRGGQGGAVGGGDRPGAPSSAVK